MNKIKDVVKQHGTPIIGKNTGAGAELVKKYKETVEKFMKAIKESQYEKELRGLVNALEDIIAEAEFTNEQVPQLWEMFGQKIAEGLASVDEKERHLSLVQQDFSPVWNLVSRAHNKKLQTLPYKVIKEYGKEEDK